MTRSKIPLALVVPLALAHLRVPHFTPGTAVKLEVTVEHRRELADAVVRKPP